MTTLIFIRHAMSEGNVLEVCSGQKNYPLVEQGFEQAKRLSEYLFETYPIKAIYSSDLLRCVQTAEPTAKAFGFPIHPDARLREVCVGEWEGIHWKQIATQNEELYRAWSAFRMHRDDPRPRGAESFEDVVERMNEVIREIVTAHTGEHVAVFLHGKALRTMTHVWRKTCPVADAFLSTRKVYGGASCTLVEFDDDGKFVRVILPGYNDFLQKQDRVVAPE